MKKQTSAKLTFIFGVGGAAVLPKRALNELRSKTDLKLVPYVPCPRSTFELTHSQPPSPSTLAVLKHPHPSLPGAPVDLFVGLDSIGYLDEATTAGRHRRGAAERTGRGGALQGLEIRLRLSGCTPTLLAIRSNVLLGRRRRRSVARIF